MNILSSGLLWGILLIAFGTSIIVKSLFGISIPIIRPLIGLFLIYIGTVIITNMYPSQSMRNQSILFSKAALKEQTHLSEKYTVLCAEGIIDLSQIPIPSEATSIEIDTIMGSSTIILNPNIPTKIIVNAAFSSAQFPDDTIISFGSYVYRHVPSSTPLLEIRLKVVFGSAIVVIPQF